MTIGNILKPYSFVNNTETADATKINANFDVAISGTNDCINALNTAAGTTTSVSERLSRSINADGSIKPSAVPVGTYDARSIRTVTFASLPADKVQTSDDAIVYVDTDGGGIAFTLLPASSGVPIVIVHISSSGNETVITPDAADTILGMTEISLSTGGESMKLAPGANTWWRIG